MAILLATYLASHWERVGFLNHSAVAQVQHIVCVISPSILQGSVKSAQLLVLF